MQIKVLTIIRFKHCDIKTEFAEMYVCCSIIVRASPEKNSLWCVILEEYIDKYKTIVLHSAKYGICIDNKLVSVHIIDYEGK